MPQGFAKCMWRPEGSIPTHTYRFQCPLLAGLVNLFAAPSQITEGVAVAVTDKVGCAIKPEQNHIPSNNNNSVDFIFIILSFSMSNVILNFVKSNFL